MYLIFYFYANIFSTKVSISIQNLEQDPEPKVSISIQILGPESRAARIRLFIQKPTFLMLTYYCAY